MNVKDIAHTIFIQAELYTQGGKLLEESLEVVNETRCSQLKLIWKHPKGSAFDHSCVVIPCKTKTLHQRAMKLADLDLLKAFKEIGNAYVRELNAATMDYIVLNEEEREWPGHERRNNDGKQA